jgi:hypothetical protein
MGLETGDLLTIQPIPWSRNALGRLGKCLAKGEEIPNSVPVYDEVMLWYNDLTG